MAAFLAAQDEIAEALEHGFPMRAAWEELHGIGRVRMTYDTFRVYCRNANLGRGRKTSRGSAPKRVGGLPPQTFEHNSVPDKKKLY